MMAQLRCRHSKHPPGPGQRLPLPEHPAVGSQPQGRLAEGLPAGVEQGTRVTTPSHDMVLW
jgi:hypothetical protein